MARPFSRQAGRQRSRGQSIVEIALVLPLFLVLLMILFDFGRVVFALNTINQDAREGVRKGIVSTAGLSGPLLTARYGEIRTAALTMAPAVPLTGANIFGSADGSCSTRPGTPTPMPDDAPPNDLTCFYPYGLLNSDPATPPKVVVRIQVTVPFITPIIGNILGGGITISTTAEQLIQS
jgi:Flp pilus assembly protein TadG